MSKDDIGALWKRKARQSGKEYLSGEIRIAGAAYKIVLFPNEYKTKENQPDLRIYLEGDYQPPNQDTERNQADLNTGKPWSQPSAPIEYPTEDINPEDIPF